MICKLTIVGLYFRKSQGKTAVLNSCPAISLQELEADQPSIYGRLVTISKRIEQHFKEVQRVTFTVEDGKIHVLQSQCAPLSPKASTRISVENVREGFLPKCEVLMKLKPSVSFHTS